MTDDLHGMTPEPDLDDPVQVIVHRVIEACKAEFMLDAQVPRLVVVAECPPDGRIGMASTADGAVDTHRMLSLAAGAVRNGMSTSEKRKARALWDTMRAGFERRN